MAEFCIIFRLFFGERSVKKNSFWDLLTFRQTCPLLAILKFLLLKLKYAAFLSVFFHYFIGKKTRKTKKLLRIKLKIVNFIFPIFLGQKEELPCLFYLIQIFGLTKRHSCYEIIHLSKKYLMDKNLCWK